MVLSLELSDSGSRLRRSLSLLCGESEKWLLDCKHEQGGQMRDEL
jgi:hypothetical protein